MSEYVYLGNVPAKTRYYIYKHDGTGNDEVLYRIPHGDWSYNFDLSCLHFDLEETRRLAKQLSQIFSQWYICIGKVHVVVDGFFPAEVVNDPKA